MTCEDLNEEYDAFALGISDGPELAALREHLAADCPVCVPGVRNSIGFISQLSALVPHVDPPPRLRRKVVNMVRNPPSRMPWFAGIAAAFAILAFIAVYLNTREARSSPALALLTAADVRQLAVQQPDSRVDIFSSPTRGVLLLASNFKPAPAGKTYEMWLIAKDAQPAAAGLFTPHADGSVLHIAKPLGQPLAAVAVTVEPENGSDHPTTKPFLVATP